MYEGLPTIEKHRKENINLVIEELKAIGADEIFLGDAYASYDELEMLKKHQTENILLPVKLFENLTSEVYEIMKTNWVRRIDYNDELIRLSGGVNIKGLKPFNNIERKNGHLPLIMNNFLDIKVK